jgi:ribosomal protein L11 methyltransferase
MNTEASWLEVSLLVNGEMAEAVAEVLGRFVSGGVVIESTEIVDEADGAGYPEGKLRVCGYLPIDPDLAENRQRLEKALWYLGRIRSLPDPVFKPIIETNWVESWQDHYKPVTIGRQLVIVPAWIDMETSPRIEVRIDPGMAFGTGTHPTTQLCLEVLETLIESKDQLVCSEFSRLELIDVGCGSGIISIAAIKLGLDRAFGVDVDPDAIAAARHNAALNSIFEGLEFEVGSVVDVCAGKYSIQYAALVVVNILAPILIRLMGEGLGDLLLPGGKLILSGILTEQETEVLASLQEVGLNVENRLQQGDWVALVASRRG